MGIVFNHLFLGEQNEFYIWVLLMLNFWTPIKYLYSYSGDKYWLMQCICGVQKELIYKNFKYNKSTNCGCKRKSKKLLDISK